MGKFETKKKKKKSGAKTAALILGILALAAVMVLFVMPRILYRLSGEAEELPEEQTVQTEISGENAAAESIAEMSASGVEYPVKLENGQLVLENLFQYEGINPDCGLESGRNTAAVTLRNVSDAYLSEAALTLELSDGRTAEFYVTDLPAGKAVNAFAADNAQLEGEVLCVDVRCEASWEPMEETIPEAVSYAVDGITIAITNNTAQEIPELRVYCRDLFGDAYFGGKTQEYTVNNVPANGTVTVEAQSSLMGLIEVVRVETVK